MNNHEQEMCWVDAWNHLGLLLGFLSVNEHQGLCLLGDWSDVDTDGAQSVRRFVLAARDDGRIVTFEECKGWLQDSCYENWRVEVRAGRVLGRLGIWARRWRGKESERSA